MVPTTLCNLTAASVAALALASCAPVSPQENRGVFAGTNAQAAAATFNRASTATTGGLVATGSPQAALSTGLTTIIAKHQASVRQRGVAQQRARAIYASLVSQRSNAKAAAGEPVPSRKAANAILKKSASAVPRYIAVETVKDQRTASGAAKAIMLWDTEAQEIVGNNVYDISNTPPIGSTSRFETFPAEYVGAGL